MPSRRTPSCRKRPYLLELYDHPKFIVRNLIRQWGGWWNGNAADLFPAPHDAQAREIIGAGRWDRAADRTRPAGVGREPARHGRPSGGMGRPGGRRHIGKRKTLKRDVYERCMAASGNLMAQGVYRAAMNDASEALGGERVKRQGPIF